MKILKMQNNITKKMEAQQDLRRYYKLLPTLEDNEDRDFFLRGVVNLQCSLSSKHFKCLVEFLRESPYTFTNIAGWCCVPTKEITKISQGIETNNWKKIYVGINAYS